MPLSLIRRPKLGCECRDPGGLPRCGGLAAEKRNRRAGKEDCWWDLDSGSGTWSRKGWGLGKLKEVCPSTPHLIDIMGTNDGIEERVEVIEQVYDSMGSLMAEMVVKPTMSLKYSATRNTRLHRCPHLQLRTDLGMAGVERLPGGHPRLAGLQPSSPLHLSLSTLHGGSICVSSRSVFCFSSSSSSVRSSQGPRLLSTVPASAASSQ